MVEADPKHTAVILFHGIGNPRRFDLLDRFLDGLRKQVNFSEEYGLEDDQEGGVREVVSFNVGDDAEGKHIRAYEGYWGTDMPKPVGFRRFLCWVIKKNLKCHPIILWLIAIMVIFSATIVFIWVYRNWPEIMAFITGDWALIKSVGVVVLFVFAITTVVRAHRFFRQRLSNIHSWATLDERDSEFLFRERRIREAEKLIGSVTANDGCRDCVIVGHSLGSAIAWEAILRMNMRTNSLDLSDQERNRRRKKFEKIKVLFSLGSPIEYYYTLFQDSGDSSAVHSAKRRAQKFQTSSSADRNAIRIINIWSRFDLISSFIDALKPGDGVSVQNMECWLSGSPNPFKAHSGYFESDVVMRLIRDVILSVSAGADVALPEILPAKLSCCRKIMFLGMVVSLLIAIGGFASKFVGFNWALITFVGGCGGMLFCLWGWLYCYSRDVKRAAEQKT